MQSSGIMWRGMAVPALLMLSTVLAGAQGRVDARNLTCGEARGLVQQNGAIVFTTGQFTYDRYVLGDRYCPSGHIAEKAWITTRDSESCLVGHRCILDSRDNGFFKRFPR